MAGCSECNDVVKCGLYRQKPLRQNPLMRQTPVKLPSLFREHRERKKMDQQFTMYLLIGPTLGVYATQQVVILYILQFN